ncbi:MAG: hypothetical protein PUD51_00810 [Prevotellaceae bacterium]|nr:hypothetical protein [Prevotellaceae bacterium]
MYSHNYALSVKLACLLGRSAGGVYTAVCIISAWGLGLLVSTVMGNSYGLKTWSE